MPFGHTNTHNDIEYIETYDEILSGNVAVMYYNLDKSNTLNMLNVTDVRIQELVITDLADIKNSIKSHCVLRALTNNRDTQIYKDLLGGAELDNIPEFSILDTKKDIYCFQQ